MVMMHPLRESANPPCQKTHDERISPCQIPSQTPIREDFRPSLPHLGWSVDAKNGQARRQNRDDALNHRQSRPRDLCIIIDNEA